MPLNDALTYITCHLRRYILTCIDEVSYYSLAMVVRQFFEKCFRLTPFSIRRVVNDGGSEFNRLIEDSQMVRLWAYPKSPRMNAVCERFNRTVQKQLVDFHEDLLFIDLEEFNEKYVVDSYIHLIEKLTLVQYQRSYNRYRPHSEIGLAYYHR